MSANGRPFRSATVKAVVQSEARSMAAVEQIAAARLTGAERLFWPKSFRSGN